MSYIKRERKPPEEERRCQHYHPNNDRCRVLKLTGYDFCYFHEPTNTERRLANSRKGGHTKAIPIEVPAPVMETLEDVRQFTVETLHQVRTGEIEPRTAAVVSSLVAHVLKTLPEIGESDESTADKLRGLLNDDVPTSKEDEDVSESVPDNRPDDWEANPVQGI